MSDGGFDFRKVPEHKTPKPFEPPPWEKEAFDELKRKREQEVPAPAVAQAPVEPVQVEEGPLAPATEPRRTAGSAAGERRPQLDEKQVIEMLAGLAEEEPDLAKTTRRVAFVTAIVLGALGMVLMVWGMAAIVGLRGKGPIGFAGGAILEMFGIGFLGAAVWLVYRTLKRQGVI